MAIPRARRIYFTIIAWRLQLNFQFRKGVKNKKKKRFRKEYWNIPNHVIVL